MQDLVRYPVRYNHVGYVPCGPKVFFVVPTLIDVLKSESSEKLVAKNFGFRVETVVDGAVAFEGLLREGSFEHSGVCEYSNENLWSGDFSKLNVSGEYRIQIVFDGKVVFTTEKFEISDSWIERQLKANIKSFYYQRSGVELPEEFAGKWARPAAHFDDCIGFHKMMNREGTWNAHGGWYDAGDYGKYIVNGGVSVGTMLLACSVCDGRVDPKKCSTDFVNVGGTFELPTSLKEELRFELDFFARMQDSDGGVFFKVSPEHWDGFISPKDSDLLQKRLILGKSTTSTLNFAGVMAAACGVFRSTDERFAGQCLQAAERAYRWAVEHPDAEWPHNTEGSGGYGDEHVDDEFFWARVALFCNGSFGELKDQIVRDMEQNPPNFGVDWRDTQNMGWMLLALQDKDLELQRKARETLEKVAAEIIRLQKADPYGISIRRFIWGSNGEISNHALTLAVVSTWRKEVDGEILPDWCREQLNFVYGRNPVNRSFVTGSAWSSPMHVHHRLSHSDGVKEPIPGLLAGGLNKDRQDMHRAPHYPSLLEGHSYTDERCSFASNETAINWNSPLTAVLSILCL
ncbi:MAG: glycoside hydrolase family 9 protein [Fibrobacter sp.]|nr:glycoside hydrolase family 9 protein [Fibrobacter sp.]